VAERRLLVTLDIDASDVSCRACRYVDPVANRCALFTGTLEVGAYGPHRADECLDAERRQLRLRDAIKAVGRG